LQQTVENKNDVTMQNIQSYTQAFHRTVTGLVTISQSLAVLSQGQ